MSKHTIQISDEDSKTFQIVVSIGYTGNSIGNWRSIEKGCIRYTQGRVEYKNAKELTVRHVYLYESPQSDITGLRLNDYCDWTGVNDEGMGYLWQPWVLDFKPYRISWVLVD